MKFKSYEAQVSGAQLSAGSTVEGSFVGAQLSGLICRELKCRVTDKILSTLVNDKLLIEGNWFAVKRADGSISLMPGYLKTFPTNDIQDQQDFARLLTKYGIHYHDFEQSFKTKKN
jgi:hypothetical protein